VLPSLGGDVSSVCDSLNLSLPLEAKIIHNATKIRSAPTAEPTAIPTFAPVPSPPFDDELGIADEVALDKLIFEFVGLTVELSRVLEEAVAEAEVLAEELWPVSVLGTVAEVVAVVEPMKLQKDEKVVTASF